MHGAEDVVHHAHRAVVFHRVQVPVYCHSSSDVGVAAVVVELLEELRLIGVGEVDDVLAADERVWMQHIQRVHEDERPCARAMA